MRQRLVVSALFVQFTLATTAMAVRTVDFTTLGASSIDITMATNPVGAALDGVIFKYDNAGSAADTALVDSTGISGSTFGALTFLFISPTTQLNFDFSLLGVAAPSVDGVTMTFTNAGALVTDLIVPANTLAGGNANGSVAYNGAAFNQVTMFFSLDSTSFTAGNVTYLAPPATNGLTNVDFTALGRELR